MKGIRLLLASLPLALLLLTGQATAADDVDDTKVYADARQHLSKAKISLADAIGVALKKHAGGHAIEAGFEVEGDDCDFVVEVAAGGKIYDVEIHAESGKIESDEPAQAEADEKAAAAAVVKSKVTLAKAVGTAIEAVGVKGVSAFDAGPHVAEGKLIYEVGLLAGKDIYDVQVDGATGKVLAKKKVE